MPPRDVANDPRVAKLLSTPVGRVGFAAAGGVLLFELFNNARALVGMIEAWQEHVVAPALNASREAGLIDADPEKAAADVDVEPSAPDLAGDPSSPFAGDDIERTSWGAEIPQREAPKVRDAPQA